MRKLVLTVRQKDLRRKRWRRLRKFLKARFKAQRDL